MVVGVVTNGNGVNGPGAVFWQVGNRGPRGLGQQVLFHHHLPAHQPAPLAPVRHQGNRGWPLQGAVSRRIAVERKASTRRQPAVGGILEGFGEGQAMGLHGSVEVRSDPGLRIKQAIQGTMPIVALQGPIEHHQTAGQAPIGDRAFQAKVQGRLG